MIFQVNREALTKEALQLLRLIPEGYIPLPHQVGGHRHVDGKLGKGSAGSLVVLGRDGSDQVLVIWCGMCEWLDNVVQPR